MNKFIKLTRVRGNKTVYVNVHNILYFNENNGNTSLKFSSTDDNAVISVVESLDEVLALINDVDRQQGRPLNDI